MSGPIVRTGATPEFWSNWDRIFGDKPAGSSKKKTAKKSTKKKTAKKAAKSTKAKTGAVKKTKKAAKKKTATRGK